MTRDDEQLRIDRKVADFMLYMRLRRRVGVRSFALSRLSNELIERTRAEMIDKLEKAYPDFKESYDRFILPD